jgi:hypothetical protein
MNEQGGSGGEFAEIPDYIRDLMDSGELEEIRLDKEGNWFHAGEAFTNERIIDFFNRSVDVTKDGTYVLHYADFTYPINVEDAPVFVSGIVIKGFGIFEQVVLQLSTATEERLDHRTLFYRQESGLYCYVRGGRLKARFRRSPFFQILERLEESDDTFYISICGEKVVLTEKTEEGPEDDASQG